MTKTQLYIIIIIVTLFGLGWLGFSESGDGSSNLPESIGDPLELVVVKNNNDFDDNLYSKLKTIIGIELGPSPQPEKLLSIMEIDSEKFRGVLQRHQNLLFIEKSDTFAIQFKHDLFAENQLAILIQISSVEDLIEKENEILGVVKKIKKTEIERLAQKFKKHANQSLFNQINERHGLRINVPKDFFIAHEDSNITWLRRETPKISQGLVIANSHSFQSNGFKYIQYREGVTEEDTDYWVDKAYDAVDRIISAHISGPLPNSYMMLDRSAPISISRSPDLQYIKIQSLWRMENDFMGGIFQAHFLKSGLLVYTYLYAPGEKKSIPLLQLEALLEKSLKSDIVWKK